MDSRTSLSTTLENLSFPNSWASLFIPINHDVNNDPEYIYRGAIELLKDYCNFSNSTKTIFHFGYYHTHKDIVKIMLEEVLDNSNIHKNRNEILLLKLLEMKLVQANHILKPTGSLVKRIAYIQSFLEKDAIDLVQLCQDLSEEAINHKNIEREMNSEGESFSYHDKSDINDYQIVSQEVYVDSRPVYTRMPVPHHDEIQEINNSESEIDRNYPSEWINLFVASDNLLDFAIKLLKDYCCYDNYFYNLSSFFKGSHHHSVVREVIRLCNTENVYEFLQNLQSALMRDNQFLKPNGELVKRIAFIQEHLEDNSINLDDLCEYLSVDRIERRERHNREMSESDSKETNYYKL